jgi:hypothetical protein
MGFLPGYCVESLMPPSGVLVVARGVEGQPCQQRIKHIASNHDDG